MGDVKKGIGEVRTRGRWATTARRLVVLLAALALVGCSGAPLSLTGSGGGWRHLRTDHFDLYTDLGESDALDACNTLEQSRSAILTAAWSKAADRGATSRAVVVVFGNGLEFEHYAGRNYSGAFTRRGRPTLLLWGPPRRWEQKDLRDEVSSSVLRHEIAHRLAAGFYRRQPRWFSEGLAQFLESVVINPEEQTVILGRPNTTALRKYQMSGAVGVRDILAWKNDEDLDERTLAVYYGVSWIFVHWLYNTQFEAFAAYQQLLAAGAAPEDAFQQALGGIDLDTIDKALYAYSHHGEFQELTAPLDTARVQPEVRTVRPAEVEAIHAQAALAFAGLRHDEGLVKEAREALERGLHEEPGESLALRLRMTLSPPLSNEELVAALRTQVALQPSDGDAWAMLGGVLDEKGALKEKESALRMAVVSLPDDPGPKNDLAWLLAMSHRGPEALPLAEQALALAPWDAYIIDTYAATLVTVGRCQEGIKAQERALDLLAEAGRGTQDHGRFRERLKRYRTECAAGKKGSE